MSLRYYNKGGRILPIRPAPLYPARKPTAIRRIKKKVNALAKTVRAEVRVNPTTSELVPLTQAQIPYILNGMDCGDVDGKRDATQIQMKYLQVRMSFVTDDAKMPATNAGISVRCMIVYDRMPNGAVIPTSSLLQTGGTASRNYYAPTLHSYRKRFKVLYDKNYALSPHAETRQSTGVGVTTYDYSPKVIKISKKINLGASYVTGAGAGTIVDLIKGSLYLLIFSSVDANWYNVNVLTKLTYNP